MSQDSGTIVLIPLYHRSVLGLIQRMRYCAVDGQTAGKLHLEVSFC
jgi:hypothetical protein